MIIGLKFKKVAIHKKHTKTVHLLSLVSEPNNFVYFIQIEYLYLRFRVK